MELEDSTAIGDISQHFSYARAEVRMHSRVGLWECINALIVTYSGGALFSAANISIAAMRASL